MMNATALNMAATPVMGSTVSVNTVSGKSNTGFLQMLSQALQGEVQPMIDGNLAESKLPGIINGKIMLLLQGLSAQDLEELLVLIEELMTQQKSGEQLDELFTDEELSEIRKKFVSMEHFLGYVAELITVYQQTQPQQTIQEPSLPVANDHSLTHQYRRETVIFHKTASDVPTLNDEQLLATNTANEATKTMNKSQLVEVIKTLLAVAEKQEFAQNGLSARTETTVHFAALQNQNQAVTPPTTESPLETESATLSVSKVVGHTEQPGTAMGQHQEQGHTAAQADSQTSASVQEAAGKLNTHVAFADHVASTVKDTNQTEMKMTYTTAGKFQEQMEALVVNQAKLVTKPNGQQTVRIMLHPENLGSLQVTVVAKDGQVTASIVTDSLATKELLDSTIGSLRAAMLHTGIQIDRIDVQQGQAVSNLTQPTAGAQGYLQHQRREQQEQQQSKKHKDTGSFSLEELEELALDFVNENQLDRRFIHQDDLATTVNYTV